MPPFLFYFFAAIAVFGALGVVINRNPVSGAFSMIASFVGVAALFIGLNAYFIGILQILVYAGAIMVLFIFIIMLLDVQAEEKRRFPLFSALGAGGVAVAFAALLLVVLTRSGAGTATIRA